MVENSQFYDIINNEYPRIATTIKVQWGTKECHDYLNLLVFDVRDGSREGFPKHVFSALLELSLCHDRLFPQFVDGSRVDPFQDSI